MSNCRYFILNKANGTRMSYPRVHIIYYKYQILFTESKDSEVHSCSNSQTVPVLK